MQRHELEAWLGDTPDLLDEQIAELLSIADEIEGRYPNPEDQDEATAALTTAYRLMVEGDGELIDELANKLMQARIAQAEALASLQQAALMVLAPSATADGYSPYNETEFANAAGVDRMTVRKWLGKR